MHREDDGAVREKGRAARSGMLGRSGMAGVAVWRAGRLIVAHDGRVIRLNV